MFNTKMLSTQMKKIEIFRAQPFHAYSPIKKQAQTISYFARFFQQEKKRASTYKKEDCVCLLETHSSLAE